MTDADLINFVESEIKKSQDNVAMAENQKSWIDQGSAAKRALRAQQNAIAGIWTILKGAMANAS